MPCVRMSYFVIILSNPTRLYLTGTMVCTVQRPQRKTAPDWVSKDRPPSILRPRQWRPSTWCSTRKNCKTTSCPTTCTRVCTPRRTRPSTPSLPTPTPACTSRRTPPSGAPGSRTRRRCRLWRRTRRPRRRPTRSCRPRPTSVHQPLLNRRRTRSGIREHRHLSRYGLL